jgi:hypothetical protein
MDYLFISIAILLGMMLGILATFRRLRQLRQIRIGDWMYEASKLPDYRG